MDGLYFDVFDEEIATAFSIYCGISIMHSIVYKKMQDAQARNKLSNEIMMYHMKVNMPAKRCAFHNRIQNDNYAFSRKYLSIDRRICRASSPELQGRPQY